VILTLAAFLRDDDCEVRVFADERSNSIIMAASEVTMQQAWEILRWVDVAVGVGS
jgi:hypothetical protein